MAMKTIPRAPSGLSPRSRDFWSEVNRDYALEPHDLVLLRAIVQTMDRVAGVTKAIDEQGVVVPGSKGQPRPNGLLTEERNLRVALARLLRELDLDGGPNPDTRIPRR